MLDPDTQTPKVMIVGAGLGGLTLGLLLEQAGVEYQIFERSGSINPIGSAIALSVAVMPMFEQLGLMDRLKSISKAAGVSNFYREANQEFLGALDNTGMQDQFQYERLFMSRPALYDILLEHIPKEKIFYNKKLLSHQETGCGIILRFSDNSEVEGHILVGADGCNSGVRQWLYKQLERSGDLPASDKLPLKYSSIALVGQTGPLDVERFTFLKSKTCEPEVVISDTTPSACVAFPTIQNTICWMAVEFLDKETRKTHDNFRTSEWGVEAAAEMAKSEGLRRIVLPGAASVTLGELMDLTPKTLMSKVMLEEKIFKTWTHGRTVLLGDACHKMSPSAGQGAVNAMLDAIVLSNYIEALQSNDLEEIENSLKAYKKERYTRAKAAVEGSSGMMVLASQGLVGNVVRKIALDPPNWLRNMMAAKTGAYRPQVAFLPPVEDKGSVKSPYQPSLHLPTSTRRGPIPAAVGL